jgi:hypothetical protein
MKAVTPVGVAAATLVLAACGSGAKKAGGYTTALETTQGSTTSTFTAPTTVTVERAQTGATMRCANHGIAAGALVPAPGNGVSGSADGASHSATLTLTRKSDGSLVVSCS